MMARTRPTNRPRSRERQALRLGASRRGLLLRVEQLEDRLLRSVGPVGAEFRVNASTTAAQLEASIAMDDAGDVVVAWESKQNATSYEIYARRYSSSGTAQGSEFVVDSDPLATLHDKRDAAVAMDNSGNFAVTWSTFGQDVVASWEIYARRYSSA